MTLKTRIALNLSIAFTIILMLVMAVIYVSFSKFRQDEFHQNLEHSAETMAHYLSHYDIEELHSDEKKMDIINVHVEDFLYGERILVFDETKKLVFSNVYDEKIHWNTTHLERLESHEKIFWHEGGDESLGLRIKIQGKTFYILVTAEDINGNSKLNYLEIMLLLVSLVSLALIWISSFYFMRKQLKPLDDFTDKITDITTQELNKPIREEKSDNEINSLVKNFNLMMARLNASFQAQKEFAASASHEFKTPLTRMAFQLENLKKIESSTDALQYIESVQKEVYHLSDTVNSLLILSKTEAVQTDYFEPVRIDEVVFESFANVRKVYKDFEIDFQISDEMDDSDLTVNGIWQLLEIVFINFFKNVCLYANTTKATVKFYKEDDVLKVSVASEGALFPEKEQKKIFEAFHRGENSGSTKGSGLGLRICKRIMEFHSGQILYHYKEGQNIFTVVFS